MGFYREGFSWSQRGSIHAIGISNNPSGVVGAYFKGEAFGRWLALSFKSSHQTFKLMTAKTVIGVKKRSARSFPGVYRPREKLWFLGQCWQR